MPERESSPPRDLAPGAARDRRRERLALGVSLALGLRAIRLLGATLRLTESNRESVERLWAAGTPAIYATWHGRILMFPYFYGRLRSVYVLTSRSRDGELMSRFARALGFRVVRG